MSALSLGCVQVELGLALQGDAAPFGVAEVVKWRCTVAVVGLQTFVYVLCRHVLIYALFFAARI